VPGRAATDETYDVAAEIAVPALLPEWIKVEPCPPAHLAAMVASARAVRGRAEAALDDLAKATPPGGKTDAASRLKGLAAEADSVTSFGESLWSPDASGEVREGGELAAARHRRLLPAGPTAGHARTAGPARGYRHSRRGPVYRCPGSLASTRGA
jgi:hypothetical protein